jgi:hypothetical protein
MVEIDYLAESRLRRRLHRRKYPDQRVLARPSRYLSSNILLNAIGTAGAASSEAKKTLFPLGSSDINSASIDEVKSRLTGSKLISENAGRVASIATMPMLATGSSESAANPGRAAFAG